MSIWELFERDFYKLDAIIAKSTESSSIESIAFTN